MRSARKAAASASAAAVVALPLVTAGIGTTPDTATGQEPADPVTAPPPPPAEDPQVAKLRWQLRRMTRRAYRYKLHVRKLRRAFRLQVRLGGASGLERGFLCIHRFEGSWSDAGDPYWGGLQMDWSFMRTYGGEFVRAFGPASNWTPAMQLAVAERAYLSGRGYGPWPTTRRLCGL